MEEKISEEEIDELSIGDYVELSKDNIFALIGTESSNRKEA